MNNSVGIYFAALALSIPCAVSASDSFQSKSFPATDIREIDIQTDSGAITLTASNAAAATVDVSPAAAPGDDCRITVSLRGGRLTLSARASKARFSLGLSGRCSAGFSVSAPPHAGLKASSGSGKVEVGAFSGKADVRTGSGDITLRGPSGALTARSGSGAINGDASGAKVVLETGSGDISVSGLTGAASVKSGSGAVSLTWASVPRSGTIDVRTGSGSLTALLPASARLRADLTTASGSTRSDFESDSKAPLRLDFHSGSGSATIKKVQ